MGWLSWLGIDTRGFDAATLAFEPPGGSWGWIALALAFLVALGLSWRGARTIPSPRRRAALLTLRFLAFASLFLIALAPAAELRRYGASRRKVAVLVDLSQSMTIRDGPSGESRIQLVEDFLRRNASVFRKIGAEVEWVGMGFSGRTRPLDLGGWMGSPASGRLPEASGRRTDLAGAFREVERLPDLAGVVLLSDGADNAGLRGTGPGEAGATALARELGAPINVFQAGGEGRLKDVSIARVRHDAFAFAKTPVEIDVDVGITGYRDKRFPVTLKHGDTVVSSQEVDWHGEAPGRVPVRFKIAPEGLGTFVYTVEAPVFTDDAIPANNRATFALRVIRDKIRVLQIVGKPSWDERFLRDLLKSDANIDLISFFILRTNFNLTEAPQNELALIPFPVDELFTKELKTFDLVIFQNFTYGPYFNPFVAVQYLQNLRNYVLDGGAFVMIGGDQSFELGGYAGSPLEEVLPVGLPSVAFSTTAAGAPSEDFVMRLTPEGAHHPITNLEGDPRASENLWRSMPPLQGVHEGDRPKPGAVVLGETPGRHLPVVAVWSVGKGRTMAVLTDSTWHWNFLAVGRGESNRTYQGFWRNAIRWLTKDPRMKQVEVRVTQTEVHEGEEVAARVRVLDENYRPVRDAQVRVELVAPSGKTTVAQPVQSLGEGEYEVPLHPVEEGYQTVRATARRGALVLGTDEDAFAFEGDRPEWTDPQPAPRLLRALALAGQGTYQVLPASLGEGDLHLRQASARELQGWKRVPLWDHVAWFLIPVVLLTMEWFLRRRWGLP